MSVVCEGTVATWPIAAVRDPRRNGSYRRVDRTTARVSRKGTTLLPAWRGQQATTRCPRGGRLFHIHPRIGRALKLATVVIAIDPLHEPVPAAWSRSPKPPPPQQPQTVRCLKDSIRQLHLHGRDARHSRQLRQRHRDPATARGRGRRAKLRLLLKKGAPPDGLQSPGGALSDCLWSAGSPVATVEGTTVAGPRRLLRSLRASPEEAGRAGENAGRPKRHREGKRWRNSKRWPPPGCRAAASCR